MRYKNIVALILVLFSLFAIIGLVSAAPLTPSDDVKKAIKEAPSGAVIELDPTKGDFKINSIGMDVTLNCITIKSSKTNKNAVIDLGGKFGFIGDKLTFINITMKNGKQNGATGTAISAKDLTLIGCTFMKNTATGYSAGGAISSEVTLTATKCIFKDNTAASGGAIVASGKSKVTNCIFTNNKAPSASEGGIGGAIIGNGALDVTKCTFTKNIAYLNGGAIVVASGKATITNSKFTQNAATHSAGGQGGGGAVSNFGKTTIKSCTFTKNTGKQGTQKGTLYSGYGKITTSKCTFK